MARNDSMSEPYLVTPEDPTFNLLIYGDSGNGKTTLAASAQDHPEMANVMLMNIEGGTMSIAHREDIHAVDIGSTEEVNALAWKLAQGQYRSVQTVIVDNGTELQTLNLEEIVDRAIKRGRNKVKGQQRTIDDLFIEDYKASTMQLKRLFRFLRDLPINFILTTHAKRVYPKVPEGTDLTQIEPIAIVPFFTDKLMVATFGYMDFVWCLEFDGNAKKDEPERYLITVDTGPYRCKTRGPKFFEAIGPMIEEPNLADIYDMFVRSSTNKSKRRK